MTDQTTKQTLGGSLLRNSSIASGLVKEEEMDYARRVCRHRLTQQGLPPNCEIPDRLLADILIEQDVLTEYQADQLMAGRTKFYLGPYLITHWIGQGGMGQVFKGIHQVMGRVVAVKTLQPKVRATAHARDAFEREIRTQAELDCPYLVRAFDAGVDGPVHYLVTEYVPGMDLRRLVKSQGALPVQQAARIVMQAALGLDYAHSKGLVHRDVKPGNILVTPEGEAKVSDIGLASFAKDLVNDPRAGKIVGTSDYLSPEQIRTPLEVTAAADIYSLGCTLYYAICGKVPFPGGDTESKLRRHLQDYPLHPRNFAPDVTEDFVDIIVDMMEKDASRRITSAAEVADRLEPWAAHALNVGAPSMIKSPWLAPPPPTDEGGEWLDDSHGSEAPSDTDGKQQSTQTSQQIENADFEAGDASAYKNAYPAIQAEEPGEGSSTTPQASRGFSTGMVIALTVAIILPPAILLGAILGYILAQEPAP